jgi:hypothetical protein
LVKKPVKTETIRESVPTVKWASLSKMQLRMHEKSERFSACKHYEEVGDNTPTPWLRKHSPKDDLKFIAGLSELELSELKQLMPHPRLWLFLQCDTEARLDLREEIAIEMHMSKSSVPAWFEEGQVINLDDDDWRHKVNRIVDQLHESNTSHVRTSEAQHRERELSAQRACKRREEHVDTSGQCQPELDPGGGTEQQLRGSQ